MSVFRFAFLALASLFLMPAAFSQTNIAIGEWRSHFPNYRAKTLTQAGNGLYCSTEGGFFYFDLSDYSMHTLSKVDGFSDVDVQFVSHDQETGITLVAYRNTNLDLIQPDGQIFNLSDILRKSILGAKEIRNVYFHQKMAYLSTSFGVVVVDLVKREIKDTYTNLGPNGKVLDVLATAILNDSIYISARNNNIHVIQAAPVYSTDPVTGATHYFNLLDFNNWTRIDSAAGLPPDSPIPGLAAYNGKMYAAVNGHGLYYLQGQTWLPTTLQAAGILFSSLESGQNGIMLTSQWYVAELTSPSQFVITYVEGLKNPRDAHRVANGYLWVADYESGLLRIEGDFAYSAIPDGPFATSTFDISAVNGRVVIPSGSYDQSYTHAGSPNGFYVFEDGQWTNFNPFITDSAKYPTQVRDIVEAEQDPLTGDIYMGTHGHGLLKWTAPGQYELFNDQNSPLTNSLDSGPYVRIDGLAFDRNGTLWVTSRNGKSFGAAPSLFEYKNNTWTSYSINFRDSGLVEKLVADDYNQKWMILSKNKSTGILVYNSTTKEHFHLTNSSRSKLPANQVNCITKDLEGAIWAGTTNGVAVYASPSQIMSANYNIESRPRIEERFLLEDQNVNDIAVDGGNRKWIATDNGLWLFNEDGNEQIHHFTAQNSPLPNNKVTRLGINQKNGEVFAATEAGLVSYRGAATLTETDNSCKGVFPNPVRPGFTGMVGINGVPENGTVKITDLAGTLVHEVKASGNTATWNLQDYNGRRVQAGVYLLLGASSDGTQQYMCKVAVLD